MNDAILLAMIQECIRHGKAVVYAHVMPKHGSKGFTIRQGIQSILVGQIIEMYPERDRVLICGEASDLKIDSRFIGVFIHSSVRVEWRQDAQVVIITMYRPDKHYWTDHETRRRT